jgi:hypothetical protein
MTVAETRAWMIGRDKLTLRIDARLEDHGIATSDGPMGFAK